MVYGARSTCGAWTAKEKLSAKSPLGIPWLPAESVAPVVVFLASDDAALVSGATYDVTDGDSANNATQLYEVSINPKFHGDYNAERKYKYAGIAVVAG